MLNFDSKLINSDRLVDERETFHLIFGTSLSFCMNNDKDKDNTA